MQKHILLIAFFLSGCSTATLVDSAKNEFVATATQGEFEDKIKVSWIKTSFYKNYTLYRSDSEDGLYVPLREYMTEGEFNDTNITPGQEYFYKVQGYNDLGTPMFMTAIAPGYGGSSDGFYPPGNVRVSSGVSTKELKITWNRSLGAVSYQILKSTDNDFFEIVAETPYLNYIDTDVEIGNKYYYRLTAINDEGIPSPNRSIVVSGELFGGNIGLKSPAGSFDNKIQLEWWTIPYVTDYVIYRSENKNSIGSQLISIPALTTEKMSFEDTNVRPAVLYYYTISYKNDTAMKRSDTVRSYLKTDSAPTKPQSLVVSQGTDTRYVNLSWSAVEGATLYEISRSATGNAPWIVLNTTDKLTYKDLIPNDSYTYFYTVTGLNPAPGEVSDIKEGWANKPPVNITTTDFLGDKVRLTWTAVPGAIAYNVYFSDTQDGNYSHADETRTNTYNHVYDIGVKLTQDLYYKVEVVTPAGTSTRSESVKGTIKKIEAPQSLRVVGNKTPTKSMTMSWANVGGARGYVVYRAILDHRNSQSSRIVASDFREVGRSDNASFTLNFNTYPIRRYIYSVAAIDRDHAVGVPTMTDMIWRLPVDVEDFARDVDFTIIEAQTQIPNFGAQGSGSVVQARANGNYDYYAGFSGSKNIWNEYTSFEATVNGAPSVSVDIGNFSAKLNGTMVISGLYDGKITYNNLNAKEGGFVFAGSMTIEYKHPTQGWQREDWSFQEAAKLQSVVLQGSESPPRPPSYEQGGG